MPAKVLSKDVDELQAVLIRTNRALKRLEDEVALALWDDDTAIKDTPFALLVAVRYEIDQAFNDFS